MSGHAQGRRVPDRPLEGDDAAQGSSGQTALVDRARAGDVPAFEALYGVYARTILSYLYRMTGSREDAEELTQETFILAFRNLRGLKESTRFQAWVYRIARNCAYQRSRKRTPVAESIESEPRASAILQLPALEQTPEAAALSGELRRTVDHIIGRLPERNREVFVLSVLHHHSYQEISEIVGRSLASVKSDIHRARVEVRDRLKKYLEGSHGLSRLQR